MGLPILCYHKVGPVHEEGRGLNIEPSNLARHVAFFARRRYGFALPRDLSRTWPARAVCFTFDDAYASTLANAPEIFLSQGTRCAFYAVSGRIGDTSDWDGDRARPMASWEQLLEAHDQGFEIGNHSASHVRLTGLPLSDQLADLSSAKSDMERRGIRSDSVCYPFGAWNATTIHAATECGYKVGLALGKRPAKESDYPLALPRIAVAYGDGIAKLLYKIHVRPLMLATARR